MRRAALLSVSLFGGLLVAQYLSGYLFLWSIGLPPWSATPFTCLQYLRVYRELAEVRERIAWTSIVSHALVITAGVVIAKPRKRSLHGNARFARPREIAAAGLLEDDGILLGMMGRRFLMLSGQQGVAIAAPPRSGKGTGVVIPNLLNWKGSVLCLDIKRENWTLTAGYRAKCGQAVLLFDPFAPNGQTACWNPLTYVAEDHGRRINDLQRIAEWDLSGSAERRSLLERLSPIVLPRPRSLRL